MVQSGQIPSERRSAERFKISLPAETDKGPGVTRDISLSGLYLVAKEGFSTGDRLHLIVALTDGERSFPFRLAMNGRVVRVEDVEGGMGAGIAVDEEGMSLRWAS